MAISIIQNVEAQADGDNSFAIAVSALTAGSLVAVVVGTSTGPTSVTSITDGTNTYTQSVAANDGTRTAEIWRAVNVAAGATTITVNLSGSQSSAQGRAQVIEIAGIATTSPDAGTSSGSGADASAGTSVSSFTPSVDGCIVIGAVMAGVNGTWTAGTGYTKLGTSNRLGVECPTGSPPVISPASAQTVPFSFSAAQGWVEVAVAYKPPTAASGTFRRPANLSGIGNPAFFHDPLGRHRQPSSPHEWAYSPQRKIFIPRHVERGELVVRAA